ncbi:hypothetical protein PHMEG_00022738 [Phytophthora megakarya]|uniref:DDE Tnp4 domain-containing protein n=1 Tax=Phytophthora megakarya TaxID=4795 RepID=A0A225VHZ6_9STRA|nr:hypothetical protein PHMEG_00022738 [Phytophthora megakarya]
MSFRAFESLVALLAPSLHVDEVQSRRRTGIAPLSPVNKVQMCISWLAGYSFHPVRALAGTSKTAFYCSIHAVMDAKQEQDELQLLFPVRKEDQRIVAHGFAKRSSNQALTGCFRDVQKSNELLRFFSGHYQCYGINVRACVDHHSRLTAVSCKCPGGMGDSLAYEKWNLSGIAEELPLGLYLVGNNAYSNGNKLLTPFTKPKTKTPVHDSFNFNLSQLRIQIERPLVSK